MPRSRTRNTESNYNTNLNYSGWVYNDDIENSDEQLREHSHNETNSINNMERSINSYENYIENQSQYSIDNHSYNHNQHGCIYNEPCNQEMNSSWGNESNVPLLETSEYNIAFNPPSLSNEYEVVDIPSLRPVNTWTPSTLSAPANTSTPRIPSFTPPSTPSSTNSMPELEEKELIPGDYIHKNHDGKLLTKGYKYEDGNYIYYLKLKDILKYVTCGGGISDSYLDELTSYVLSNVPTMETVKEEHRTIDGKMYLREMPAIKWHQYGIVAKYCLDWAISNPEKLTL